MVLKFLLGAAVAFSVVTFSLGLSNAQQPDFSYPIRTHHVSPSSKYPKGRAEDSLWFACANLRAILAQSFRERLLPYDPALERVDGQQVCHIYYEPTLRGFRADADDQPVQELFIDPSVLPFITKRPLLLGDSYDLASLLLPALPGPLKVVFGMQRGLKDSIYQQALAARFGSTPHQYSFRHKPWESANPWTQDYLKSGTLNGKTHILVTHMAYEGKAKQEQGPGSRFRPLEEQISDPRFTRSKLAWEGGDLQFVQHPRDPQKLVMFYGRAAVPFWASNLSKEEYEYILKLEFGADIALDLGGIVDHVDYLVMPVPGQKTLLFGQPERQNLLLARSAFELLAQYYTFENAPNLEAIGKLLSLPGNPLTSHEKELKSAIQRARARIPQWKVAFDADLLARVEDYIKAECQGTTVHCFQPNRVEKLLASDDSFILEWGQAAIYLEDYRSVGTAMLAIIEGQLEGFSSPRHKTIEEYGEVLEAMGFRLVRVPLVGFEPSLKPGYSGLSYVNSFVTGNKIFLPSIGFSAFERSFLPRLQAELPGYQIRQMFARHAILHSGGVHCMVGIVRAPIPKP